jgi:hypothetical protein
VKFIPVEVNMANCEMDICTRMKRGVNDDKRIFRLGHIEFNLRIKKNKPKKITHFQYFMGRDIMKKKDAKLFIKNPDLWVPFEHLLEMYGYKKAALSVIVKFHRSLDAKPYDVWIDASSVSINGKSYKYDPPKNI